MIWDVKAEHPSSAAYSTTKSGVEILSISGQLEGSVLI